MKIDDIYETEDESNGVIPGLLMERPTHWPKVGPGCFDAFLAREDGYFQPVTLEPGQPLRNPLQPVSVRPLPRDKWQIVVRGDYVICITHEATWPPIKGHPGGVVSGIGFRALICQGDDNFGLRDFEGPILKWDQLTPILEPKDLSVCS